MTHSSKDNLLENTIYTNRRYVMVNDISCPQVKGQLQKGYQKSETYFESSSKIQQMQNFARKIHFSIQIDYPLEVKKHLATFQHSS